MRRGTESNAKPIDFGPGAAPNLRNPFRFLEEERHACRQQRYIRSARLSFYASLQVAFIVINSFLKGILLIELKKNLSASSYIIATILGLGIPALASILPIKNALNQNLQVPSAYSMGATLPITSFAAPLTTHSGKGRCNRKREQWLADKQRCTLLSLHNRDVGAAKIGSRSWVAVTHRCREVELQKT